MASSDPVEQAMGQYSKRMSEHMLQAVRPVRKGKTLTLATSTSGKNPQMVQVAVIGVLVALLLPAVQAAREAARRAASQNNMKRIGLGMHNYATVNKTFPPAYKADANGKPLLSWRVLILPFVSDDGDELFKQFHLDEPWDSDHNKPLIAKMPAIYRNPNSAVSGEGKTNYLTVRNEKSVFPGGKGIGFADITDGTSNTIMTVEVPDDKTVIWTKPDDFTYDESEPMKGLTGLRAGGFIAGFADGSVRFIASSIDATVLKALFTRNGGEAVGAP
jgi:type II secretory pathway pseudopilin PulG